MRSRDRSALVTNSDERNSICDKCRISNQDIITQIEAEMDIPLAFLLDQVNELDANCPRSSSTDLQTSETFYELLGKVEDAMCGGEFDPGEKRQTVSDIALQFSSTLIGLLVKVFPFLQGAISLQNALFSRLKRRFDAEIVDLQDRIVQAHAHTTALADYVAQNAPAPASATTDRSTDENPRNTLFIPTSYFRLSSREKESRKRNEKSDPSRVSVNLLELEEALRETGVEGRISQTALTHSRQNQNQKSEFIFSPDDIELLGSDTVLSDKGVETERRLLCAQARSRAEKFISPYVTDEILYEVPITNNQIKKQAAFSEKKPKNRKTQPRKSLRVEDSHGENEEYETNSLSYQNLIGAIHGRFQSIEDPSLLFHLLDLPSLTSNLEQRQVMESTTNSSVPILPEINEITKSAVSSFHLLTVEEEYELPTHEPQKSLDSSSARDLLWKHLISANTKTTSDGFGRIPFPLTLRQDLLEVLESMDVLQRKRHALLAFGSSKVASLKKRHQQEIKEAKAESKRRTQNLTRTLNQKLAKKIQTMKKETEQYVADFTKKMLPSNFEDIENESHFHPREETRSSSQSLSEIDAIVQDQQDILVEMADKGSEFIASLQKELEEKQALLVLTRQRVVEREKENNVKQRRVDQAVARCDSHAQQAEELGSEAQKHLSLLQSEEDEAMNTIATCLWEATLLQKAAERVAIMRHSLEIAAQEETEALRQDRHALEQSIKKSKEDMEGLLDRIDTLEDDTSN